MLTNLLLILCLNIDALSYGLAYGAKKIRIKTSMVLFISVLSTILFLCSIFASKIITNYLDRNVLNWINGSILIILGIYYFFEKEKDSLKFNTLREHFLGCIIISLDAIFTTLISGYLFHIILFYTFFYFFTNIFAIFIGNQLTYTFNKLIKFNLSFLSGTIFIILGILKILGF